MRTKSKLIVVVCAVLLGGTVWAAGLSLPEYSGFVNDYAAVLSREEAAKLESLAQAVKAKTGAEMAVAIVSTAAPADPKTYAHELFNKWGIGQKGKDNGLLIFLAMAERRVEIEVGSGLEGAINDAKAGAVLDKYVIPYFKQGRFGEGLYEGAAALAAEVAKEAKVELGDDYQAKAVAGRGASEEDDPWGTAAVTILILLMMFAQGLAFGIIGAIVGGALGFAIGGLFGGLVGALLGFVVSYFSFGRGRWYGGGWTGGSWGGGGWSGGGGGFGGFGGGGSGGGGAGRSW